MINQAKNLAYSIDDIEPYRLREKKDRKKRSTEAEDKSKNKV